MYDQYYGFSRSPFGLTPDVRFCYRHRSYTRAKAYMQYAVMREEGFLVVTGRPGMGKTTLIQDLLAELGAEQRLVARVDSTQLDADDLLRLVTYGFELPARGLDKATLLHGLEGLLRRRPEGAGTAILVVDEAQDLPDRSLEELRLITNLQQGARALIQIFLVGQDSLRDVIRQPHLEQLQQRIVAACHLEPLDLTETRAYIRHRLLCAGWSGDPVFEADALLLIHRASGGVPRLINKVCDRLLLYGSVDEAHRLGGQTSRLVIQDFRGELFEEPEGGPIDVEPMGPDAGEAPIADLIWEPEGQTPPQAPVAGGSRELGSQSGAEDSDIGGAAESAADQGDPEVSRAEPTQPPSRPIGGALTEHPGVTSGHVTTEDAWTPAPAVGKGSGGAFRVESGGQGPALVSGETRRAPGDWDDTPARPSGREPRRRRSFLPYAAMGALLLGVGSLALVLQGGTPEELAARLDGLVGAITDEIQSLAGQWDAEPGQVASDPFLGVSPHPPAVPEPAAAPDPDLSGLARGAESETAAVGEGHVQGVRSDTAGLLDEPAPPEPLGWDQGVPGAVDHSDTIETTAPAEPVELSDAVGTATSADAAAAGPQVPPVASPSLAEELRRLGYAIRDLEDGRLTFDLGDEIPFARNSARLPGGAARVLEPLAAALVRNPQARVTLVGHTDDRGPADYNRRLSLSRARAVEAYLIRQGVPEHRLSSQGMGMEAPPAEPGGPSRARQRRVEVVIEPVPEPVSD